MAYQQSTSNVFTRLFKPVAAAYPHSDKIYECRELPDLDFIEMGMLRCLSPATSGRDFLQLHGDQGRKDIGVDHFFKSIKSPRRLGNLRSVNSLLATVMDGKCDDPFASISELDNFAIYAGDGHFHAAAAHDPASQNSKGQLIKRATGHFFTLNLRTYHLAYLALAECGGLRKAEHDMRVIKRSELGKLRGGEAKGRKVILVWDKAGIDFAFWQRSKQNGGLYFISREKENMNLMKSGDKPIDRRDKRNAGVVSDELVSPGSGGSMLRRIVYIDPLTQTRYSYLTTEMTLAPWIIVLIYKKRWDIEKVFDELKNKLNEWKSWSKHPAAKEMQAQFLCLAHNLMVLLEEGLRQEDGVDNGAERMRKEKRRQKDEEAGANFVATAFQRFTVRSVKFIRWLRSFVYRETLWSDALARLRQIYAVF